MQPEQIDGARDLDAGGTTAKACGDPDMARSKSKQKIKKRMNKQRIRRRKRAKNKARAETP